MEIRNLFSLPNTAVLNDRGELYTLTRNTALGEVIKLWLTTKPGDLVGYPNVGGYPYLFMNVPLTTENANAFRSWLYTSLTQEFFIRLQVQTLEVVPDPLNRRWKVYGSFFAPDYGALSDLQVGINI